VVDNTNRLKNQFKSVPAPPRRASRRGANKSLKFRCSHLDYATGFRLYRGVNKSMGIIAQPAASIDLHV
jgi:hypothetical protein